MSKNSFQNASALTEWDWEIEEEREARLTSEAMLRPLFEEPSSDCEREDPWSGPKGFMIGGMGLPTHLERAEEYFQAAEILVGSISQLEN